MADNEATTLEHNKRKQVRQPPSVPFLWEDRPGIPKKDWKLPQKTPTISSPGSTEVEAMRLFASIPFIWEEKPGKPLTNFLQPQIDPPLLLLPQAVDVSYDWCVHDMHDVGNDAIDPRLMLFSRVPNDISSDWCVHDKHDVGNDAIDPPLLLLPPAAINVGSDWCVHETHAEHDAGDELNDTFEMDLQSFGFGIDESFSSAVVISSPVANHSESLSSSSSESVASGRSSTSSYATGSVSLVGLDCIFPLVTPKSGFLGKAVSSERGPIEKRNEESEKSPEGESNHCRAMVRRPPTLGELIMMSRRRSHRRKAVQMRTHNFSMKLKKKMAVGCGMFGMMSGSGIGRVQARLKSA